MNSVSIKARQTDEAGPILLDTETKWKPSLYLFTYKHLLNMQRCRKSARLAMAIEQFAMADGTVNKNYFAYTINRLRQ